MLRQADTVQVLMTQRHAKLSFMGGMWVFPGGALSASDRSEAALDRIHDSTGFSCEQMRDACGQPLPHIDCLALAIAACRETFEECGLLLARHDDGTPCNPTLAATLQSERAVVIEDPTHFIELLRRERLRLDIASLLCWSHWITPSAISRRFDTHFFVVAAPEDQQASTDSREATQHCWLSPGALRTADARGEMSLPHPTLFTLMQLDTHLKTHGSINQLLSSERQRRLPPILPKLVEIEQQRSVLMPWDADYHSSVGEGTPADIEFPEELLALSSRALHIRG